MSDEVLGSAKEEEALQELEDILPPILFRKSAPPEILELPPRAQAVLILTALGYMRPQIAKMLRMGATTVDMYRYDYDPDRKFRLSKEQLREVRNWKWQQIAVKAQDRLLEEGMLEGKKVDVRTLLNVAKTADTQLERVPSDEVKKKSVGDLLKRLREERGVEGESKVIEAKDEKESKQDEQG